MSENKISLRDYLNYDRYKPVKLHQVNTNYAELDRYEQLEEARRRKEYALSNLNDGASLDNSYTQLDDGTLTSNKNKIWNDLSDEDIQDLMHFMETERVLTNKNGVVTKKDGSLHRGWTGRLYAFGTDNDAVKIGISRGDKEAEERYRDNSIPGLRTYGWKPGKGGVNVNNKLKDILLSSEDARLLEGVIHGRRSVLDNRMVTDMHSDLLADDYYGGGYTEYYDNLEGVLGQDNGSRVKNFDRGKKLYEYYYDIAFEQPRLQKIAAAKYRQDFARAESLKDDTWYRATNAVSAFASGLVNSLVDAADAVGELSGTYDISDSVGEKIDNFFEHDTAFLNLVEEEVNKDIGIIFSFKTSTIDKKAAASRIAATAFVTPELVGTSLGFFASLFVGVGFLGKIPWGANIIKGSKTFKAERVANLKEVRRLADRATTGLKSVPGRYADKIRANVANLGTKEGLIHASVNQGNNLFIALGQVNNQYKEFVGFNGGQELVGKEKAMFFLERLPIQMASQHLDRLVSVDILTGPSLIRKQAIKAAAKQSRSVFKKFVKGASRQVANLVANGSKEAFQEYVQSIAEVYNARYGSEEYKDVNSILAFIMDERVQREAIKGGLIGAGVGGQMHVVGAPVKGFIKVGDKTKGFLRNNIQDRINTQKQNDTLDTVKARESEIQARVDSALNNKVNFDSEEEIEDINQIAVALARRINSNQGSKDVSQIHAEKALKQKLKDRAKRDVELILGSDYYTNEQKRKRAIKKLNVLHILNMGSESDDITKSELEEYAEKIRARLGDDPFLGTAGRSEFRPSYGRVRAELVDENNPGSLTNHALDLMHLIATNASTKDVRQKVIAIQNFKRSQQDRLAAYVAAMEAAQQWIDGEIDIGETSFKNIRRPSKDDPGLITQVIAPETNAQRNRGQEIKNDIETLELAIANLEGKEEGQNLGKLQSQLDEARKSIKDIFSYVEIEYEDIPGTNETRPVINNNSIRYLQSILSNVEVLESILEDYEHQIKSILGDPNVLANKEKEIEELIKNKMNNYEKEIGFRYVTRKLAKNSYDIITEKEDNILRGVKRTGKSSSNVDSEDTADRDNTQSKQSKNTNSRNNTKSKESNNQSDGINPDDFPYTDSEPNYDYFDEGNEQQQQEPQKQKSLDEKRQEKRKKYDGRVQEYEVDEDGEPVSIGKVEYEEEIIKKTAFLSGNSKIAKIPEVVKTRLKRIIKSSSKGSFNFVLTDIEGSHKAYLDFFKEESIVELLKDNKSTVTIVFTGKETELLDSEVFKYIGINKSEEADIYEEMTDYASTISNLVIAIKDTKENTGNEKVDFSFGKSKDLHTKGIIYSEQGYIVKEHRIGVERNNKNTRVSEHSIEDALANEAKVNDGEEKVYVFEHKGETKILTKSNLPTDEEWFKELVNNNGVGVVQLRLKDYIAVKEDSWISKENPDLSEEEKDTLTLLQGDAVDSVNRTIKEGVLFESRTGKRFSFAQAGKNPALKLLFNSADEINEKVALASQIALHNLIYTSSSLLSKDTKSRKAIAQMYGVDEYNLSQEQIKALADKGMMANTAITSLGNDIVKILGLKFEPKEGKNIDMYAFDILKAGLGQIALGIGIEQGLLDYESEVNAAEFAKLIFGKRASKTKDENATIPFVSLRINSEKAKKVGKEIKGVFENAGLREKGYSYTRPKTGSKFFKEGLKKIFRNLTGNETPEISQKALEALETTAWKIDIDVAKKIIEMKEDVKKRQGYFDIVPPSTDKLLKYIKLVVQNKTDEGVVKLSDVARLVGEIRLNRSYYENDIDLQDKLEAKNLKELDSFLVRLVQAGNNEIYRNKDGGEGILSVINKIDSEKLEGISTDLKDSEKLPADIQIARKSVNDDIDKEFETLEEFVKEQEQRREENTDIYFDYKFLTNFRFQNDSIINPVNNKLHRFLISPVSNYNSFKIKNNNEDIDIEITNEKENVNVNDEVYFALAQAFGFSVNNKPESETREFGKKVFKNLYGRSVEELAGIRKGLIEKGEYTLDGLEGITLEVETPSQVMMAFDFIEKAVKQKNRKNQKAFESALSADFDAKTSGFGIKLTQLGYYVGKEFFRKIGFLIGGEPKAMPDVIAGTGGEKAEYDSYETLGKDVKERKFEQLKITTGKEGEEGEPPAFRLANNKLNRDVWDNLKDALPQNTLEDGITIVSKVVREFFKEPFMVFNYASSIRNIRKNLIVKKVLDDLRVELAQTDLAEKSSTNYKLLDSLAKVFGRKTAELQRGIQTLPLNSIKREKEGKTYNLEEYLGAFIDASHGEQVEEIMNKEFKDIVDLNKTLVSSYTALGKVFEEIYEAKIKEIRSAVTKEGKLKIPGIVTKEKHSKILNDIRAIMPEIPTPGSTTEESNMNFLKSGKADTGNPATNAAAVRLVGQTGVFAGQRTLKGRPDFRVPLFDGVSPAVLPIIGIDGYLMARLINSDNNITAMHDGYIPNLARMKKTQKAYNQEFAEVAQNYNLIQEAVNKMQLALDFIREKGYEETLKDIEIEVNEDGEINRSLKEKDENLKKVNLLDYFVEKKDALSKVNNNVQKKRRKFSEDVNKRGAFVVHMGNHKNGGYQIKVGEFKVEAETNEDNNTKDKASKTSNKENKTNEADNVETKTNENSNAENKTNENDDIIIKTNEGETYTLDEWKELNGHSTAESKTNKGRNKRGKTSKTSSIESERHNIDKNTFLGILKDAIHKELLNQRKKRTDREIEFIVKSVAEKYEKKKKIDGSKEKNIDIKGVIDEIMNDPEKAYIEIKELIEETINDADYINNQIKDFKGQVGDIKNRIRKKDFVMKRFLEIIENLSKERKLKAMDLLYDLNQMKNLIAIDSDPARKDLNFTDINEAIKDALDLFIESRFEQIKRYFKYSIIKYISDRYAYLEVYPGFESFPNLVNILEEESDSFVQNEEKNKQETDNEMREASKELKKIFDKKAGLYSSEAIEELEESYRERDYVHGDSKHMEEMLKKIDDHGQVKASKEEMTLFKKYISRMQKKNFFADLQLFINNEGNHDGPTKGQTKSKRIDIIIGNKKRKASNEQSDASNLYGRSHS